MFLQSALAIGLLANTAAAALTECGTSSSGKALEVLSIDLQNEPSEIKGQKNNVKIKTYIHVIAASEKEEDKYLGDESVQGQVSMLNRYYNPWNFSFKVVKTNKLVNKSWSDLGSSPVKPSYEDDLGAAVRQGSYKDVNLFFVRSMVPFGKFELPIPNPTKQDVINDCCMMRPRKFGKLPPTFDYVTVHEVGHWIGLEHAWLPVRLRFAVNHNGR